MKEIIRLIEVEKEKLSKSEFLNWLSNSNIPVAERLSFTPSMLFFIMGFKDLLSSIHIENPKTKLEHIISTHCEEDLHHWKWYISDLQSLGYSNLGNDLMEFSSNLWSEEKKSARELIYKSFNYHYNRPSLVTDFILIEVMEATFGAFSESMKKCVMSGGAFSRLDFFGEVHHHAEENHTSGTWIDGESIDSSISSIALDSKEKDFAANMVLDLFSHFEEMFSMWHSSRVEQQSPIFMRDTRELDSLK